MTPTDAENAGPAEGVGGAVLEHVVEPPVMAWFSEGKLAPGTPKEDVLAFHRVVEALFRRGPVVPFRFPTTLPDARALETWLAANAKAVAAELERLAGMVQMELHIPAAASAAVPIAAGKAASGREYLEARSEAQRALHAIAEDARAAVGELAAEWRERETRAGVRCYALVARGREKDFVARIGANKRDGNIRVSGPWPPAEFLDPALTRPS